MRNLSPLSDDHDAPGTLHQQARLATQALMEPPHSLIQALAPLLGQVMSPVWVKGADRRYLYVNAACAGLHKCQAADMLGRTDQDLHGEETLLSSRLLDSEALLQATPLVAREWFPDVLSVPVTLQVTRQRVQGLAPSAALLCHAEPVFSAQNGVSAEQRAVARHFALLAHEFGTPLAAILGSLRHLATAANLAPEQRDTLQALQGCAAHLADLASDMLDMDQALSGQQSVWPVATDLARLVQDAADWMRPRVDTGQVELRCSVAPGLPKELLLDPLRLRQVLLNLLSNAVRHTDRGFVAVRVQPVKALSAHLGLAPRGPLVLRIEVEDTGDGLTETELATLFQPFKPRRIASSRAGTGAGLGLPISQSLVQAMGSTLRVRSRPGAGSTFWFDLKAER